MVAETRKSYRDRCEKFWQSKADEFGCVYIRDYPDHPKPEYGDWWGDWQYKPNNTLNIKIEKCGNYEVDLESANTLAQCANWVFHMSAKSWLSAYNLGQLVLALSDIKHISR